MLDQHWRTGFEKGMRPVGTRLRQAGFTADQITLLGLAASLFTGIAIGTGHFLLAAAGLAASGLTDVLDGAVAKSGGTAGPRGAFFDSVCDRASDALVLGGAAWYLAGGSDPQLSVLAFAVAGLSFLVSYERAKADALGFDARGGLMERAERMMLLGLGLIFGLLIPVLWILLAANAFTVTQRFLKVWQQATPSGDCPDELRPDELRRPAWWLIARPASSSESRLARWRYAAGPPGHRPASGVSPKVSTDRSRLAAWLVSARPPRDEAADESRLGRWWTDSRDAGAGVRSQLRRLRGRTRP